ncbi:hypothetical protein ACIP98_12585 [Streptomyces sp. NPDC088354]|uniref:hypothetical protein n=1 Tax=unclassified Streptomyces TaxID=2593676 RepID=UPI0029B1CC60|nr:hypothetical protein [Streptomyces sp. MI02-7b]MDX3072855.1 hypothetical protein [Streptomyces sp. MI02-7b]
MLVNLALGVPAAVPLYCAWWLLTEYLPMDCRSISDATAPGFSGTCDYHTLDHAGPVMFLLVLSGLFAAALVLLVDVVRPHSRGRPARPWVAAGLLVPVPFLALLLAAHR